MDADIMVNVKMLEIFRPDSKVHMKEIITKSTNKSCDFDPPSSWLLKTFIDQHLPQITAIIKQSVDVLVIPLCLKRATTRSLLKISGMYKQYMKN